jgi:hypothetical protein
MRPWVQTQVLPKKPNGIYIKLLVDFACILMMFWEVIFGKTWFIGSGISIVNYVFRILPDY